MKCFRGWDLRYRWSKLRLNRKPVPITRAVIHMVTRQTTDTATVTEAGPVSGDSEALLRLFHLVSPALPVGAYAYSQGLEYAVHAGWVGDEGSTLEWLQGQSQHALGTLDLPLLLRLHRSWSTADVAGVRCWTGQLLAARETAELRAEDRHLGAALARVLVELNIKGARSWLTEESAFATLFALAAV